MPEGTLGSAAIASYFDHVASAPYTSDGRIVDYLGRATSGAVCPEPTNLHTAQCTFGSLAYDGSAGYDFKAVERPSHAASVVASAAGTVQWGSDAGALFVKHANGYRTLYGGPTTRLAAPGSQVTAGPVDPYGWQGCIGCDPYAVSSPTLWKP